MKTVTKGHHNQEGLGLAGREQIVEDQVDVSEARPGGFVGIRAVEKVEHRIAGVRIAIIAGRRIDRQPAYGF